jgi:hypothetical protein
MSIEHVMKGLDSIETKLQQLPELADRVLQLEQKQGTGGGLELKRGAGSTLGQQFATKMAEHGDLLQKTGRLRLELKAASDPVTTGSGRNLVMGGVGAVTGQVLGMQYGLPQRPGAGTTAMEYSRYTGFEGAAAQQATEGAAKAAFRPTHSIITQNALTIAGYTKISRQAMSDRPALEVAIDVSLRRSVDIAMDVALVNGATGFTGGFEGLATAATSLLYTALPDAISEGVSVMQVAGFSPNVVFLNPADWLAITVAKGTSNDHYLSGSYLGAMPMEMRTLRVVLSPSVDAGKALLMDTSHVELVMVDTFAIEVAYDSDDFTKNLATMLGELRFLPVFMTTGAARLITPKAP